MNQELQLKIQAYLDGELPPTQVSELAQSLGQDAAVKAVYEELRQTQMLLHGNELEIKLPDTREFYWSRIEREILRQQAPTPTATVRPQGAWWWKLLVPAAAVVALVCALLPFRPRPQPMMASLNGMEVETAAPDTSVITFRSETEGVSVVWVDTQ